MDPAPDDHLTAGPHCRVNFSCRGRVGSAGGRPTVGGGIVSAARVEIVGTKSTPDNHFSAGPDCSVVSSASGRVGGAGSCPTVDAGVVSPAGVQSAASAP